jgi:3-oxoacyl-[acyl-carrier protein] reductase
MIDLKNQVVIITGASDGLGKALAIRLAQEGARLALIARNEEKIKAVTEQIAQTGAEVKYFICDVTSVEQIQKTVADVKAAFGTIDVLVNNAGIWNPGDLASHTVERIQQLFATNTLGTIFMCKEVLPTLKDKHDGQILNVTSIAGVETVPGYGLIYVATKHAVKGFTDTLKLEAQNYGVKVSGFYPGGMATHIAAAAGINMPLDSNTAMKIEDVAEFLTFILKQPKDVWFDHFEVRKFSEPKAI